MSPVSLLAGFPGGTSSPPHADNNKLIVRTTQVLLIAPLSLSSARPTPVVGTSLAALQKNRHVPDHGLPPVVVRARRIVIGANAHRPEQTIVPFGVLVKTLRKVFL
jgi:hypothetical protein